MAEPRSLPELVAARAAGGLRNEPAFGALAFADLGDPPPDLAFLVDAGPWQLPTPTGRIAVIPPLTALIAARALARAAGIHEQDVVAIEAGIQTTVGRLAAGAAVYAGARFTLQRTPDATVRISLTEVRVDGEDPRFVIGWPECCGLAALSRTADLARLDGLVDRMEASVIDRELCVRGPLVMERYLDDPIATMKGFAGGWLRTGEIIHDS